MMFLIVVADGYVLVTCIDHPVLIMFPFSLFKDYVLEKYATKVILDELNVF